MCTEDGMSSYSLFSSCKFKTWQKERQGIKPETTAFYSDLFMAQKIQKCEVQKINVEQKVAENWAPHCMLRS